MNVLGSLALATVVVLLVGGPVWAQPPLVGADQLVISNAATGAVLFDSGPLPEGPEGPINFSFVLTTAPFLTPGVRTLDFLDPNHSISDFLTVTVNPVNQGPSPVQFVTFSFLSDPPDELGFGQNLSLMETGNLQDVTGLLYLGGRFTVQVQSDVEVPEPTSLLLLGTGLAGLAGAAWKRQRRRAPFGLRRRPR